MNDTFFTSFEETKIGKEYLTTPYDYIVDQSWFYKNIKNQFLPATTLLELQKTLPIYANTLIQVFTIPIKIIDSNGKKLIYIEPEYIAQIKKNTSKDIGELLSAIPTTIDILKWDIYELIEDLKQYFIDQDEATQENINIKINTLYNSIDKILEKDISKQYNDYRRQFEKELSDNDTIDENPIEEQIEKVKLLLTNFLKSFSKEYVISIFMEDGNSILFNIIESTEQYLCKKYDINIIQKNSDEERIKSSLQDSINNLNRNFNLKKETENETTDNITITDERVIALSENIFEYIWSLKIQPETGSDFETIKQKIDELFTKFCKDAYGEKNALKKWLSLWEDFSYIQRLIEDFLFIKQYPYNNINPDTALWMCISILNYHEKWKEKKILKIIEILELNCNIKDITREIYQKDIIILKEIAEKYENYKFASILRDIQPKI